jgi:hypothetical protein
MKLNLLTILTAFIMLIFSACKEKSLPSTFLIPSNFEGTVRIVFDETCGMPPEIENGRQLFKVSQNGIIISKTEMTIPNNKDDNFYFIDGDNKRTKITRIVNFNESNHNAPTIMFSGVGVSSGAVSTVNSETKTVSGRASYIDFNLYNKNSIEIKNSVKSDKLDSLTNELVKGCRANIKK